MAAKLRRLWADNTTNDFESLDPETTVAVLQVAAIEQHGPHLPVSVDATVNEGVIAATLPLIPDTLPIVFLPMMPIGKSNEHQAYPGTLTFSAETLMRVWTEIGESVARAGVRKLILLNSHGGNPQVMDIVARDLRVRLGMFVVAAGLGSVGTPQGLFSEEEKKHGIHGGASETSLMLHLRPDLVRTDKIDDFRPVTFELETAYKHLRAEGRGVGFGWQTQDLHMSGALGDARDSDAERGRLIVESLAPGLVELFAEVSRYPLSALRTRQAPAV